jgi:hypothetical protein
MTPTQAFLALLDTKYNATNLADPGAALDAATMDWMQAVTEALSSSGLAVPEQIVSSSPATVEQIPSPIVTTAVETPATAVEIHATDAAPSSSEPATIAPQAPA